VRVLGKEPILNIYNRIISLFIGKLANASAWMLVGSIAAGVLGYVLQVLMGRMLGVQEYALFSAIMALFTILATPLSTMVMLISRKVSEYFANQDNSAITYVYYTIHKRSMVAGVLILGLGFAFDSEIQHYLKAPTSVPVYALALLLFVTSFPFVNNAFLQGLQKFAWLSASSALNAIFKICLSVVFVWAGYGVSGAIGGAALAYILTWAITYLALWGTLQKGLGQTSKAQSITLGSAFPVFVANGAFAVMTQLDMVLVNYFFPAHEAGLYAAASILGKAVLYLPGGIALALFPMVAERHAREEGSAHLLMQALGLTFILCGIGATIYFFCGEWFVQLVYGDQYREAGELLQYYGFAIFPMSIVMVVEYFLIAKGRVLFAYLFMLIAPLQIMAVYYFHESLFSIIAIMALFGMTVVTIGLALLWRAFVAGKR